MAEVYHWVPNGVARMVGEDSIMDETAHELLKFAKRRAIAHRLTGNYLSKLRARSAPGKKGVRDRIVEARDEAAISIEFGHTVVRADGSSYWLEGQHILGGAIQDIPGSWKNSFRYG